MCLVTGKKENDAVVCHQHESSKNRMRVSFSNGDCKCLQRMKGEQTM